MDSIKDFFNREEAEIAYHQALAAREHIYDKLNQINMLLFYLEYFLKTGEPLDPAVLGVPNPEDEEFWDDWEDDDE